MKNHPANTQKKKYTRVPINLKKELLRRIFIQQTSVKQAAKDMKINYSTAKTILFLHRKKLKLHQTKPELDTNSSQNDLNFEKSSNRAGIKMGTSQPIMMCCSVGGSQTFGVVKMCGFRNRRFQDPKIKIEC